MNPMRTRNLHTLRTRIDGKRAIIQEGWVSEAFPYVYYVTFPQLRVKAMLPNGEAMRNGAFNLTVRTRSKGYKAVAMSIIRSLDFPQ